jgi:sugar lactone lactonase YvrE
MASATPKIVTASRDKLGEGAIWDQRRQALYWVDILGKRFHHLSPTTGSPETYDVGQFIGTLVPCRRDDEVLVALHRGIARYHLQTRQLTHLGDPEYNHPELRFNDGKCDPAGRFWAGTMPLDCRTPTGNLYCYHPDGRLECKLTGVTISNGIAWSRDARTMYYIDTPTHRVDAFDFDNTTGHITNRRVAINVATEMGYPDGCTLDAEGMLWIAHFGGSRVTRWNPATGAHLGHIMLPTPNVTSCAFGGKNLDQLYITTASVGIKQPDPNAGALFVVEPGVCGLPAFEFAG